MGGWGTWNVATRQPGPLRGDRARLRGGRLPRDMLGGAVLAKLTPGRALPPTRTAAAPGRWPTGSSTCRSSSTHGDADKAVNVEYSRWAVQAPAALGLRRALPRVPRPGPRGPAESHRRHEHRVVPAAPASGPSAPCAPARRGLRGATAHWVHVLRATSPLRLPAWRTPEVVGQQRAPPRHATTWQRLALTPGPRRSSIRRAGQVIWNGIARRAAPAATGCALHRRRPRARRPSEERPPAGPSRTSR